MGHLAIDCYYRMDFAFQGKNPPNQLAAMATTSNTAIIGNSDPWLTDSGALDHITANLNNLSVQSHYKGPGQIAVGNGQFLPINHTGNSSLSTKFHKFQLRNVLHVPRVASNLLSVHKLCLHNNCSCHFDVYKFHIWDIPTGRILYKGLSKNGLYPIYSKPVQASSTQLTSSSFQPQSHHNHAFHAQK